MSRRIFGRRELKLNNRIFTFLFFFALAWVFWLLIALNQNYSTNINFPVKYIHQFADKELVGDIPNKISVNVSGQGYTLLKTIVERRKHPMVFRVITLNLVPLANEENKCFVLTRTLKDDIKRQCGPELSVTDIAPDSLYFTFSPIVHKMVPVDPDVKITFEPQFMIAGSIKTIPDSVLVSGPLSLVDTIKSIITEPYSFNKISSPFQFEANLIKIEGVYLLKRKVNCIVPVEKFTQATIEVPIKAINLPDNYKLRIFPPTVSISYNVSLNLYSRINPNSFRVLVDYKTITQSFNNRLKVSLEKQPAYIKIISFKPRSVEFIVESSQNKSLPNNDHIKLNTPLSPNKQKIFSKEK